ncbi:MAG: hypothetical protein R3E46_09720 [Sedimenticolaceae bacterium]|jgi:hypothetical protein|nr:hypothetical protein [Gammaproteobacteria bacterium]
MKLDKAVRAWGTPNFQEVLKDEIEQCAVDELPLSQALRYGNYVADEKPAIMVHRVEKRGSCIVARIGLFFAGIDAGSCCANDPTPVQPRHEYCVIQLEIEHDTGETKFRLIDE